MKGLVLNSISRLCLECKEGVGYYLFNRYLGVFSREVYSKGCLFKYLTFTGVCLTETMVAQMHASLQINVHGEAFVDFVVAS